MSGDKQCDRCGEFIEWGGTYYEVCEVTGSSGAVTHELCGSCGYKLEAWVDEAPRREATGGTP